MESVQDQIPKSYAVVSTWRPRFCSFESNAETIRTTSGTKDGHNIMFQLGFNESADLTSQEFAARYTGLKLANLSSTMRTQNFESRLRDERRQMLNKHLASKCSCAQGFRKCELGADARSCTLSARSNHATPPSRRKNRKKKLAACF